MSSDAKSSTSTNSSAVARREKGVRIFTYPKLIFIFPTLVMALICWVGMISIKDDTRRPSQPAETGIVQDAKGQLTAKPATTAPVHDANVPLTTTGRYSPDFKSPQNMLGLLFLGVFAFNMLILTFDFPRFTIVAAALLGSTVVFFLLWLGMKMDFLTPLVRLLDGLFVAANSGFYFVFAVILMIMYGIVFLTRWLDYWEFMPNEILHHHGPWSDLERFPTMNLKFDKEIPDVFEHMLFGAGRLVFHVANEQKAIILDNVLHINRKEEALKQIMSRLEVRVTTDQEVAQL